MRLIHSKLFITSLAVAAFACAARAQSELNLPDVSQAAEVRQQIALTDVAIKYHRPLVNGRKIWGGLVPYGQVWRAGANENTIFKVSDPVTIEGQALPKGVYGLHAIPTADSWTIIFSKTNTGWGSYSYKQDEDALRVTVKPHPLQENEEALEYEFEDVKPTSATVTLKWEKLAVPFKVAVTDQTTLDNIRAQMKGRGQFEWQSPDEAAQFCLSHNIDLEQGLKWADMSIANEERFDNLGTKADLLRALHKDDEATQAWAKALEKATAAQLYSYGRRQQNAKKAEEGLAIMKEVAKRYPQDVYGHLAQARVDSAAGDFPGAIDEIKKAQTTTKSEAQKTALQPLLDRLQAHQDINK
jgi:Flp pilus assembly protein TadD, contains TPR repeats